jgi:RNA polymerase sigma-70 factor (ECF subfamily)
VVSFTCNICGAKNQVEGLATEPESCACGSNVRVRALIHASHTVSSQEPAFINGSVGLIFAPRVKLFRALTFTFTNVTITRVEVIGDPARLRDLDIAVL